MSSNKKEGAESDEDFDPDREFQKTDCLAAILNRIKESGDDMQQSQPEQENSGHYPPPTERRWNYSRDQPRDHPRGFPRGNWRGRYEPWRRNEPYSRPGPPPGDRFGGVGNRYGREERFPWKNPEGPGRPGFQNEKGKKEETVKEPDKVYPCEICRITLYTLAQYTLHINGSRHKKNEKKVELFGTTEVTGDMAAFRCDICNAVTNSSEQMDMHKNGQKHVSKCNKLGLDPSQTSFPEENIPVGEEESEGPEMTCNVCNVPLRSGIQYVEHMNSKKHKQKAEGKNSKKDRKGLAFSSIFHGRSGGSKQDDDSDSDSSVDSDIIELMSRSRESSQKDILFKLFVKEQMKKFEKKLKTKFSGLLDDDPPKMKKVGTHFHCDVCDVPLNSEEQVNMHIQSSRHQANLRACSKQPSTSRGLGPVIRSAEHDRFYCKLCQVDLNSEFQYQEHILSKRHQLKLERDQTEMAEPSGYGSYPSPQSAYLTRRPFGSTELYGRRRGEEMDDMTPVASGYPAYGPRRPPLNVDSMNPHLRALIEGNMQRRAFEDSMVLPEPRTQHGQPTFSSQPSGYKDFSQDQFDKGGNVLPGLGF